MAYDFKKEFKEFYRPKTSPSIINIPSMKFLAIEGKGNPNNPEGEYQKAIFTLYPIAYALRMSYKGEYKIEGFFEYVVPPLEGLWWQEDIKGYDSTKKDDFSWISMIRLPDFIQAKDFDWAIDQVTNKKGIDCSKVQFLQHEEGLVVQCMHIGPYDDEPRTVALMDQYTKEQGYVLDLSDTRRHHEIYISDFRKTEPSKLKTIIRHPIKKI